MGEVWTEKYRPKKFGDIVGQEEIVARLSAFVKQKNLPNLLFAGPAGIGKTSLILVIARELYSENWRQNILETNASDERGIDTIREKIKNFARTKPISGTEFKLCILDEADSLTKEAQQALRRIMESYVETCRFCLLANYSSKIIEPIQSRCAIFRFRPLSKDKVAALIKRIAKQESIELEDSALNLLYEISEGDIRRATNLLQSCAITGKKITEEHIQDIVSFAAPKEIKKILELALQHQFIKARSLLLDTMLRHGLSGIDIIKQIQKEILNMEISDEHKMKFIDKCAEFEFRMVEGADEFVQLEALLANIAI
ncbi:replication factor C small subunit [archaeon]|nr:replication factor C small subunit [archaeon]